MIYLDHAAATPMDRRVLNAMLPYFSDKFYNPSSPYIQAVNVRRDYEDAKHKIASLVGGKTDEVIITAGATESINLAFNSVNGHVITSAIEHPAVLKCALNHDHTIVGVDNHGLVEPNQIKSAIKPDTQLVSIALANNEIGTVQPIRELSMIVNEERRRRAMDSDNTPIYLHCDASQGAGQLDVNVARLGVDMLTLNSGKIYGPKQVGLLWVSSLVKLKPLIFGGGQENGLRSGTENVAGCIGFAKALELMTEHRGHEANRLKKLRDKLQSELSGAFPDAVFSGHPKHRLGGHLHISFPGLDGERLVFLLEKRGVMVATGSACSANKGTRSHVLEAIRLSPEVADGSLRLTLGHLSNDDNINKATTIIIEEITGEMKRVGRC